MNTLIHWFSNKRLLTSVIIGMYFVANVLFHDLVQKIAVQIERMLTLQVDNLLISIAGLCTLGLLTWYISRKIRRGQQKILKVIYWGFSIFLMAMSYNTIM